MFDDLPPDLDRLHTLRVWHTLWLQRIDAKIATLTRRQAEKERGRRNRPAPPEWIVELGIGERRPPLQVHTGDCHMAGKRHRPIDRDEARRLLTAGLTACGHCRPDNTLGITDLSSRPTLTAAAGSSAAGGGISSGRAMAGSAAGPTAGRTQGVELLRNEDPGSTAAARGTGGYKVATSLREARGIAIETAPSLPDGAVWVGHS